MQPVTHKRTNIYTPTVTLLALVIINRRKKKSWKCGCICIAGRSAETCVAYGISAFMKKLRGDTPGVCVCVCLLLWDLDVAACLFCPCSANVRCYRLSAGDDSPASCEPRRPQECSCYDCSAFSFFLLLWSLVCKVSAR